MADKENTPMSNPSACESAFAWRRLYLFLLFAVPASVLAPRIQAATPFAPQSLACVLQAEALARTRAEALRELTGCGRDLLVLDYAYDGSAEAKWTPDEIRGLRNGRPGRRVVACLAIGEAEAYRPYWRSEWDRNADGKPDKGATLKRFWKSLMKSSGCSTCCVVDPVAFVSVTSCPRTEMRVPAGRPMKE